MVALRPHSAADILITDQADRCVPCQSRRYGSAAMHAMLSLWTSALKLLPTELPRSTLCRATIVTCIRAIEQQPALYALCDLLDYL